VVVTPGAWTFRVDEVIWAGLFEFPQNEMTRGLNITVGPVLIGPAAFHRESYIPSKSFFFNSSSYI
jgi:hypothetical protein